MSFKRAGKEKWILLEGEKKEKKMKRIRVTLPSGRTFCIWPDGAGRFFFAGSEQQSVPIYAQESYAFSHGGAMYRAAVEELLRRGFKTFAEAKTRRRRDEKGYSNKLIS